MSWHTIRQAILIGGIAACLGLAWGCSEEVAQAPTQQRPAVQRKPPPKPKVTEEAVTDEKKKEWKYDPSDKWDPFDTPAPPLTNQVEARDRYDLDQMLLLGIVQGSGMDGAYIRFPDGSDVIVRIGDELGKHRGIVKEIGKDYIVVEERYLSPEQPNDTFIIEKIMNLAEKKGKK